MRCTVFAIALFCCGTIASAQEAAALAEPEPVLIEERAEPTPLSEQEKGTTEAVEGTLELALPPSVAADGERPGETPIPLFLTLEEAQRIALENNPDLAAAEARILQAQARVRQAWSPYLPQVDINGSASKTWIPERDYAAARQAATAAPIQGFTQTLLTPFVSFLPPSQLISEGVNAAGQAINARAQVEDSFEEYQLGIVATWLVFDGFARRFNLAIAKFGEQQTEAALAESSRLLLSAVASNYYSAQLAREDVQIALADEAFNQQQLRNAQARRRVGTGSLSDVLNFEVRVNAARSALLAAERNYATALIALAELMGRSEADLPEGLQIAPLEMEPDYKLQPVPEGGDLVAYAHAHRPDVQRQRWAVEQAKAGVRVRKADYFPVVSASAAKSAFRDNNIEFREDDFGTTIGLNLRYNLFAGGRVRAGVVEAKAARDEAEQVLKATEINAASEVRQSLADLRRAQDELRLQRKNAEFVQRNRDLVEKEYRAGQASLVRLNEAQRDYIQASSRLAAARVALEQAWYNLDVSTARILADLYDFSEYLAVEALEPAPEAEEAAPAPVEDGAPVPEEAASNPAK